MTTPLANRTDSWQPPGPGSWRREVSHFPRGQTPLYRGLFEPASRAGFSEMFARYGIPMSHIETAHVRDHTYQRPFPLFEPPARLATRTPPDAAVWLLSRLHRGLRRRTRAARAAFDERLWRIDGQRWYEEQLPIVEDRNLRLQDEVPEELTDRQLAEHVDRAVDNLYDGLRLHFELVGASFCPLGDLLVQAFDRGLDPWIVLEQVRGFSPASGEVVELLRPMANAVARTGARPTYLDELRHVDRAAAGALDDYLRRFGHRVVDFDIDSPTLAELPGLVVASVQRLADHETKVCEARDQRYDLPSDEAFAVLLEEARYGYGIRDSNAGLTMHWPCGLLRRAVLVAGARLADGGRVDAPQHLFELCPDELRGVLRGEPVPDRRELGSRAQERASNLGHRAPDTLGPEEPLPPTGPLPAPLRRVSRAVATIQDLLESEASTEQHTGTGIGKTRVHGRARVASNPHEALAVLEPGDVLVVPVTSPAYNGILPVVAALVVDEGGALSHAALVARELDIPAVIGLRNATHSIPDGSLVEVDPAAGKVTVLG